MASLYLLNINQIVIYIIFVCFMSSKDREPNTYGFNIIIVIPIIL